MAYGDTTDPKNRVVAIVLVGLLTATLGYGLVNGLNIQIVKTLAAKLDVIEVDEPLPPEEPPPPPPPDNKLPPPPPVVVPKSPIPSLSQNTLRDTTPTPPPPQPPTPRVAPPEPPPPAAPSRAAGAKAKGNPGRWATNDDYPARAQREEREGTAGFRVSVGPDGRVTGCDITSSSGHPDLDQETCKLVTRRARFDPAVDRDGNPTTGSYANRVRWQIPKE